MIATYSNNYSRLRDLEKVLVAFIEWLVKSYRIKFGNYYTTS